MLAAKAALAIRVDALGDETNAELGLEHRAKLEMRIRQLENKGVSISIYLGYLADGELMTHTHKFPPQWGECRVYKHCIFLRIL